MIRLRELNKHRWREQEYHHMGAAGDDFGGWFLIPSPFTQAKLRVLATNGGGWDHVSVSPDFRRCPTWEEMDYIKTMFFKPDEVAMQLHVKPCDHINTHYYTLHLWRPHDVEIPLPPKSMV